MTLPLPDTGKRSTGEEELKKLNLPICDLILEKRGYEKLLGTYIDKIPECVSDVDGRLHCQFKQTGAKTGRFSSKNPNTQNIPSHEISIRMMFATEKGYTMEQEVVNDWILINSWDSIETAPNQWKLAKELALRDTILLTDDTLVKITHIKQEGSELYLNVI